MGVILSKLKENPARILMLGIDGAGKTTILYRLKMNKVVSTSPTVGFNVETVRPCKGVTFNVWDVGAQKKLRQLWKHYYKDSDGLIYVIDSSDTKRMDESRKELYDILEAEEMKSVPLLVLVNKQDLVQTESLQKLDDFLELSTLKRGWHIQACSAVNGDGIIEGLQTFSNMVKAFKKGQKT